MSLNLIYMLVLSTAAAVLIAAVAIAAMVELTIRNASPLACVGLPFLLVMVMATAFVSLITGVLL